MLVSMRVVCGGVTLPLYSRCDAMQCETTARKQVAEVYKRTIIMYKREPVLTRMRLAQTVVVALLVGLIFLQLGESQVMIIIIIIIIVAQRLHSSSTVVRGFYYRACTSSYLYVCIHRVFINTIPSPGSVTLRR